MHTFAGQYIIKQRFLLKFIKSSFSVCNKGIKQWETQRETPALSECVQLANRDSLIPLLPTSGNKGSSRFKHTWKQTHTQVPPGLVLFWLTILWTVLIDNPINTITHLYCWHKHPPLPGEAGIFCFICTSFMISLRLSNYIDLSQNLLLTFLLMSVSALGSCSLICSRNWITGNLLTQWNPPVLEKDSCINSTEDSWRISPL